MRKVYKIKIKNWENEEKGIVLFENDSILLVQHFAVDYILDGFRVYKKKAILNIFQDEETKNTQKILNIRKEKTPQIFPKESTFIKYLEKISKEFSLLELHDENEVIFYIENYYPSIGKLTFIDEYGKKTPGIPIEFAGFDSIVCLGWGGDYHRSIDALRKN